MPSPLLALPPSPPPPPDSPNWPGKPLPRSCAPSRRSASPSDPGRVAASVTCGARRLRVSGGTVQQVIAGLRPYWPGN